MTLKIPKIELTKQNAIIFTAKLSLMKQHQEELWQSLSGQEKIQAQGFVNNTLKDKYVLSHGLLRYLLSLYAERKPREIQYLVNQFGKPFLKDDNCALQFNMSHSKDYAAYIIALEDQVGIDIEWKDRDTNIQEIFELVLSPTEVTNFNQLSSEEKFHEFYDIWTKKEAIIKAIGQGFSYPIKTIEIMHSMHDSKSYCIANGNVFYCLNLHNLDNYAGTVALPGSKMKCNALECLLKIHAQKGVANEKVPPINYRRKKKDSDVKAIGALISEDCRSHKSFEVYHLTGA